MTSFYPGGPAQGDTGMDFLDEGNWPERTIFLEYPKNVVSAPLFATYGS